jgi:hypothetical protein
MNRRCHTARLTKQKKKSVGWRQQTAGVNVYVSCRQRLK